MLTQINKEVLQKMQEGKNLLAFSGGVDSSALFFLLKDRNITFDIAIVDYGVREQSKEEVAYAKTLANQYKKQCHILESPLISSHFELNARKIRYGFFNSLIITHGYTNLITAHHFDDKLEWFFMQLANGAGLNTLLGFKECEKRVIKTREYNLIRPLIMHTKKELLHYNHVNNIQYFIDESNQDSSFLRNFFRKNITASLSENFSSGLKKSFFYLTKEHNMLYKEVMICVDYNLFSFQSYFNEIHTIDLLAKRLGYVMSAAQKQEVYEILQKQGSCVVGEKIVIAKNENLVFIGICTQWLLSCLFDSKNHDKESLQYLVLPNLAKLQNLKHLDSILQNENHKIIRDMPPYLCVPKKQREIYRLEKIPDKIRPILYFNSLDIWD